MAKWENIIIHCSDSTWGSASEIRKWHLDRGWSDIGYHFVVLNGMIRPNFYIPEMQGSIEVGRMLDGDNLVETDEVGAHALGYNDKAIGICLIGTEYFSQSQITSITYLVKYLQQRFGITIPSVLGHYEVDESKSCPNMNMPVFRRSLDPIGLIS